MSPKRVLVGAMAAVVSVVAAAPIAHGATNQLQSEQAVCDAALFAEVLERESGERINELAASEGLDVTFENFEAPVSDEVIEFYECDVDRAVRDVLEGTIDQVGEPAAEAPDIQPMGTASYVASVWCGIPALGWCYVKQDFKATVTSGKIGTVSMQGSSRLTGVSIASWSHNRSWATKTNSNTRVEIRSKGTLTYGIKGTPLKITTDATFLDFWKASGSKLVAA